jgi:hypothetical protein
LRKIDLLDKNAKSQINKKSINQIHQLKAFSRSLMNMAAATPKKLIKNIIFHDLIFLGNIESKN